MMNGLDRLTQQHQQLHQAFDELDVTVDDEARIRLFAHIAQRLKAHAAVEEEVLYATLESHTAGALVEKLQEATETHRAIDLLLDETMGAELTGARVKVLRDLIERHFAQEERELFPLARRIDAEVNGEFGTAIEAYLDEFGDGADDPLPAP